MAFRKRNTALARSSNDASSSERQPSSSSPALSSTPPDQLSPAQPTTQAGIRPSPIDGRPTTSTGTVSLDAILAGHAGVPLGASLLIGETGTTDYAGALLRFYAAEGIVQGHSVTVVGMGEAWGWELPGLSERDAEGRRQKGGEVQEGEKMKIAWRYEGLGSVVGLGREGRERGAFCIYALEVVKRNCVVENGLTRYHMCRFSKCGTWQSGRGACDILPYVRSCETSFSSRWHGDKPYTNLSQSPSIAIASHSTRHTKASRVDAPTHNPPAHHTLTSLPSSISAIVFPTAVSSPVLPRSSSPPTPPSHPPNMYFHASPYPLSPLHRPSPMDGAPL